MVLVTPSPDGREVTPEGTKKKKLTGLEKSDGRRLVEYLVVVSSIPREEDENGSDKSQEMNLSTSFDDEEVEVLRGFKPKITACYPLNDHEDNPLHENVTLFCHPSGSMQLKKENHMAKVRLEVPRSEINLDFERLIRSVDRFISLSRLEGLESKCTGPV